MEPSRFNALPQQINDADFHRLALSKKALIKKNVDLNDRSVKELFINKTVSMMLLDKIGKLKGTYHPDKKFVDEFTGGWATLTSIALMRYFSQLKKDPLLSAETKFILDKWITSEGNVLPLCQIFDGWRMLSEPSESPVSQQKLKKIDPPVEELAIFSSAMSKHMHEMKEGDSFKIPSGSLYHDTRLKIIKNGDQTYDIIHYNTGDGVITIDGQKCTASKYCSVPANYVENQEFWTKFAQARMQSEMGSLNSLLSNTNVEPIPLDPVYIKSLQQLGSCTFQAAMAEFKHEFISQFKDNDEGVAEYKKCMSLITSIALKKEEALDPDLQRILFAKEKISRRYLDWMSIINDPEKVQEQERGYLGAIKFLGNYKEEELAKINQCQSALLRLSMLDKCLEECLKTSTYEQLERVRNDYGKNCAINQTNYFGLKSMKWLEYKRVFLREMIDSKSAYGQLKSKVGEIVSSLLPSAFQQRVERVFTPNALDLQSLRNVLHEYIPRENPAIAAMLLRDLVLNGVIRASFFSDDLIAALCVNGADDSDIQRCLDLGSQINDGSIKNNIYIGLVSAISAKHVDKDSIQKCLELIDKVNDKDKERAFVSLLSGICIRGGGIQQCLELIDNRIEENKRDSVISRLVSSVAMKLDDKQSLELIGMIKDDGEKDSALSDIIEPIISKEMSKDSLQRSLELIRQIKDDSTRDKVLEWLLGTISMKGFDNELLPLCLKLTEEIKSEYTKDVALFGLSRGLILPVINRDSLTQVLQIIQPIKNKKAVDEAIKFLGIRLSEQGTENSLQQCLELMNESGDSKHQDLLTQSYTNHR